MGRWVLGLGVCWGSCRGSVGGGEGDSTNAHRGIYITCQWNGQVQAAGWVNCSRTAFWLKSALQWPDREESREQKSIHSFNTYWVLDVEEVPSSVPEIQWSPEKQTCPCPWWTVQSQVFIVLLVRETQKFHCQCLPHPTFITEHLLCSRSYARDLCMVSINSRLLCRQAPRSSLV